MTTETMDDPIDLFQNLRRIAEYPGLLEGSSKFAYEFDDGSSDESKAIRRLLDKIQDVPFMNSVVLSEYSSRKVKGKAAWDFLLEGLGEEALEQAKADFKKSNIPVQAILSKATPAPFGKGSETVFDETVRKAWEIPAEHLGEKLLSELKQVGKQAVAPMQPRHCTGKRWNIVPYKMQIYGPGGKFAPHVDTLHAENHVATLVVALPSLHSGGQLEIVSQGETNVVDFSRNSSECLQAACFFTDCQHEVKEVTAGYRIVVQYDVFEEVFSEQEEGSVSESNSNEDGKSDEQKDDKKAKERREERNFEQREQLSHRLYCLGKVNGISSDNVRFNEVPEKTSTMLCDAMDDYLGEENTHAAIFLRHRYPSGALALNILKGVDRLLFDVLDGSGRFHLKLQGVVTEFISDDEWPTLSLDRASIYEVSPEQIAGVKLSKKRSKKQKYGNREKELVQVFLPFNADPGFRQLRKQSWMEHTGNCAQEAVLVYYQTILLIESKNEYHSEEDEELSYDDDGDLDVAALERDAA
jgi:hypothetical protein